MTDTTPENSVTYSAERIDVKKLLALPSGAIRRLELLRKDGCEVQYTVESKSALAEHLTDIRVSGPDAELSPVWRGMRQDLGIKITGEQNA